MFPTRLTHQLTARTSTGTSTSTARLQLRLRIPLAHRLRLQLVRPLTTTTTARYASVPRDFDDPDGVWERRATLAQLDRDERGDPAQGAASSENSGDKEEVGGSKRDEEHVDLQQQRGQIREGKEFAEQTQPPQTRAPREAELRAQQLLRSFRERVRALGAFDIEPARNESSDRSERSQQGEQPRNHERFDNSERLDSGEQAWKANPSDNGGQGQEIEEFGTGDRYGRDEGFKGDNRVQRDESFGSRDRFENNDPFDREDRSRRDDRLNGDEHGGVRGDKRFGRNGHSESVDRFDRDDRFPRKERSENGERLVRDERFGTEDRSNRTERFGRAKRFDRDERFGREDRSNRENRFGREDHSGRDKGFGREDRLSRDKGFGRDERFGREGRTSREERFSRDDRFGREDRPVREDRFGRDERFSNSSRRGDPFNDRSRRGDRVDDRLGRNDRFNNRSVREDRFASEERFGRKDHFVDRSRRGDPFNDRSRRDELPRRSPNSERSDHSGTRNRYGEENPWDRHFENDRRLGTNQQQQLDMAEKAEDDPRRVQGVFAVNKPTGMTSSQVVFHLQDVLRPSALFAPFRAAVDDQQQRRSYKHRNRRARNKPPQLKVGHGGTLDPLASGVLAIGVGNGTKSLTTFLGCKKTYVTTVLFGLQSDTYDVMGRATETSSAAHVTREQVEAALQQFRGTYLQRPPMYCARWINGERLYDVARRGEHIPQEALKPTEVTVDELVLEEWYPAGQHDLKMRTEETILLEKELVKAREDKRGSKKRKQRDEQAKSEVEERSPLKKLLNLATDDAVTDEAAPQAPDATVPGAVVEEVAPPALDATVPGAVADEAAPQAPDTTAPDTAEAEPEASASTGIIDTPLGPAARLRMTVSTGFYVRSLCHDLGLAVGTHGVMATLVRSAQSDFRLGHNVIEWEDVGEGADEAVWGPKVEKQLEMWMDQQEERETKRTREMVWETDPSKQGRS